MTTPEPPPRARRRSNPDKTPAERLTRPAPERTAPLRSGWALRHRADGWAPGQAGDAPVAARVHEAVAMAYGLIDDNVAHGRAAAERLRAGRYDAADAQSDLTLLSGRLVEAAGDLSRIWLELLGGITRDPRVSAWLGGGGGPTEPDPRPPARAAPPIPPGGPLVLRSAVDGHPGAHAADVTLPPAPSPGVLLVDDLSPRGDPAAPPIRHVVVVDDPVHGGARAVVHVPATQPPGLYDGVIHMLGETRSLGVLTLVVER